MVRILKTFLLTTILLLAGMPLSARTGGNLYRIMMDGDGNPVRLIFVRSLKEKKPEDFLLERLGYSNPAISENRYSTVFYDRRQEGEIPVLCFHRIGDDERYELSLNRVHHLMAVLRSNGYYPLSDIDFARGDFSVVPSGMKPFVIGADDAGATQLLWDDETMAAYEGGNTPRDWNLDPDCLASIFTRYFQKAGNHYNFTFYMSFDAIPFRQIGAQANPGYPYKGIDVVQDKIRYARREFYIGHHSMTHTFREELTSEQFFQEVEETDRIVSEYLGYPVSLDTLAFPYGAGHFTAGEEREYLNAIEDGRFPEIAYDLDGSFSPPPWSEGFRTWRISRFSVENSSFDLLLKRLNSPYIYQSRRVLLIHSDTKNLNLENYRLDLGGDDIVYVYIP
ncbi:MAG: polysaccharide deacetylase family protein [Spirochaetales bacterium]|nr:polysaccharide deacetylase family protein [Spirochaetales bacterium]